MTNERILGLSRYCAKLAGQVAVTYSNLEDAIGALSQATQHLDEIGDTLDKIAISLAEAAKAENAPEAPAAKVTKAKAVPDKPSSGVPGVTWDVNRKKWFVHRYEGGRKIYIGRYDSVEDAKKALEQAKKAAGTPKKAPKSPKKAPKTAAKPAKKAPAKAKK